MIDYPSPTFETLSIEAGRVHVIEGIDGCGSRHVVITAGLRPYPWTVLASRSKKRGLPFAIWQEVTRSHVKAALRGAGIEPYGPAAVLGLSMAFGAAPEAEIGGNRAVSVLGWDLRNLEKALEDCFKGLLWRDDAQVRYCGPGSARDDTESWWALHAWDGDCAFDPAWTDASVPVVEVE